MPNLFFKNLAEVKIEELIDSRSVLMGLDIGDKKIGIAISDTKIKIASGIVTILKNSVY